MAICDSLRRSVELRPSRGLNGRICAAALAAILAGSYPANAEAQPFPLPAQEMPTIDLPGSAERQITQILPFTDYAPPSADTYDPCAYLCPRPDGAPCDPENRDGEIRSFCPPEIGLDGTPFSAREYQQTLYEWEASNLFSYPLYFEDAPLERYGHTLWEPLQPFASAGLFGTQLIGLPYQMTIDPVCKKTYALGWYRPGECAPRKHYQIPLNLRAAAVQGGVVTGLIFLIP